MIEHQAGATLSPAASAGIMLNGRYLAPPADGDGKLWVRTTMLIQAEASILCALWRDSEEAPKWQEEIERVAVTGPKTSHWVMRVKEKTIEWDSEVVADEPGKRIAWRSVGGDSENAGEVVFDSTPIGGGTLVTVLQEFRMGKLASLWDLRDRYVCGANTHR